ncbi:hypothetical protein HMJ29_15530 [Hymenobacter taeanensis]|uniref:tRNA_anti-like n=1 Tax=Hymenobacter taeanensis TaxID=2735321 RepID=A0A6M6BI40_9BACT|nr:MULTISPECIES: hypothetical protein [Hymenobacter]QJX48261.1 hypothetical protein HMJ29_15530 [Hymenobacter taeanensis]UOQ82257.1 OB-fold putative lipoprotein [Hymenobacter sp. 5414T-23]
MKGIILFFCLLFSLSGFAQTLTVRQLYDEYRANKYTFSTKYSGQTITVTGKIRSISPASEFWKDQDVHRIHLTATDYENFVVCQIPYKDSAILGRFKVGEYVTVTGKAASNINDAVFLTDCTFATAQPVARKSNAPDNAPLGKYNVYQNDGTGFNYQYTFYLKSYSSYTLNSKPGNCIYDPKTKTIRFTAGPLKGFAGLYRASTDNEKDPPNFLLSADGTLPNANSSHQGYQVGYSQAK